jgi:hypothetical protein
MRAGANADETSVMRNSGVGAPPSILAAEATLNRALTLTERVFASMADRVVMNPVVMVRCRGVLDVDQVRHAVDVVQRRHPALRVRIVRDDPPWFCDRDVPPISLRVVDRQNDDHWREIVREELNNPLDASGPLIRFVLVRDDRACELICTTDHVNADGRSGLFVLRDVLHVLEQPRLRLVPLRERTCFDDYLPTSAFDLRMPDALRGLWAERTRDANAWLARHRAPAAGPATQIGPAPIEFVHRRLDRGQTAALEQACRSHDNTVLSALAIASAHARITVEHADAKGVIGCITPIDIRALLQPSVGDDFGIYAWAPTSLHPIGPRSNFWRLAQRMRKIMRSYRSMPALFGMRRLLDLMELIEHTALGDNLEGAVRGLLDGMLVVSNLGRVELPERAAGVEVEGFGFFAMIPNIDFVMGVQSFRGELEMNYCYSSRWMSSAAVHGIADRVETVLAAASGGVPRGTASRLRFG